MPSSSKSTSPNGTMIGSKSGFSGSSYADACSVRAEILDARDRVIGRQSCAANIGRAVAMEVGATGLYRLHLVGRIGNAGSLRVRVRSEARLDA